MIVEGGGGVWPEVRLAVAPIIIIIITKHTTIYNKKYNKIIIMISTYNNNFNHQFPKQTNNCYDDNTIHNDNIIIWHLFIIYFIHHCP